MTYTKNGKADAAEVMDLMNACKKTCGEHWLVIFHDLMADAHDRHCAANPLPRYV